MVQQYVPQTPDAALGELIDAVRCMGRAGNDHTGAGAQERLIQALAAGQRALEAPVLRVKATGGQPPTRSHHNDAGLDLYVNEHTRIFPGQFADVRTGIQLEFPPGWWGRIVGRSSTLRKKQLLVSEGTIDEGYRGSIFAGVWNLGTFARWLEPGERVAQLILCRTPPENLGIVMVDELSESARGESGFGSTGR